jgi:hypothetical protein
VLIEQDKLRTEGIAQKVGRLQNKIIVDEGRVRDFNLNFENLTNRIDLINSDKLPELSSKLESL